MGVKKALLDGLKAANAERKAAIMTEFDNALSIYKTEETKDYRISHKAPKVSEYGGSHNLNEVMPDIYSKGLQYYGTGESYDKKALSVINSMKDNPDKEITVYRAVPKTVTEINEGDWITTTKDYAKDHAAGEKDWHIISKKVKASEIANSGDSIHEFGYKGSATLPAMAATGLTGATATAAQSKWQQMTPQERANALSGGWAKGLSEIPQDVANIAHDVGNFGAGVLSTADIAGGLGKFGNLLMGNDAGRDASINDFMDEQNQTRSGAFGQVNNLVESGMQKAAPYLLPVYDNVTKQWQQIEANPGDASLFGVIDELNRKSQAKLFR